MLYVLADMSSAVFSLLHLREDECYSENENDEKFYPRTISLVMADIEPKIPIEADNDSRRSKQSFMRWYILSTMNQYSIRRHVHESS